MPANKPKTTRTQRNPNFRKNLTPIKKGQVLNPKGINGLGIIPEADTILRLACGNDPNKPERNELVKTVKNLLAISHMRKTPQDNSNAIRAAELLFNRVFGMANRNDSLTVRLLTEAQIIENDEAAKKMVELYYDDSADTYTPV